jgi:hypothetical protein
MRMLLIFGKSIEFGLGMKGFGLLSDLRFFFLCDFMNVIRDTTYMH